MTNKLFDLATFNGRVAFMIDQIGIETAIDRLGLSRSQVYRYKSNADNMVFPAVQKLAEASGCDMNWVATGKAPTSQPGIQAVRVSFLGSDQEPPVYFHADFLEKVLRVEASSIGLVQCVDDSMSDSINMGDVVLIDNSQSRGNGVFALRIGGELTVRRLQFSPDGSIKLISDNPSYEDHVVAPADTKRLDIAGKVIWRGGC